MLNGLLTNTIPAHLANGGVEVQHLPLLTTSPVLSGDIYSSICTSNIQTAVNAAFATWLAQASAQVV
ncbi:MAG: hypothetical protein IPL27_19410 [Lewinellaceae bacterium]|nr:hypothetical protein [Lewinellaceae bacterium]